MLFILSGSAFAVAPGLQAQRLTITGTSTGTTLWHLRSAVRIDTSSWNEGTPPGAIHRGGHVAGVLIRRAGQLVFGVIADVDIGDPILLGTENPSLAAGTYDVTLIADGPTTITLGLESARQGFLLSPGRAASVLRSSLDVRTARGALVYGSLMLPVSLRQFVLVASRTTTTAEQVADENLCLATRAEPCTAAMVDGTGVDGIGGPRVRVGNVGSAYSVMALAVYPGEIGAGRFYATAERVAAGVTSSARLVTVCVTLPA